MPKRGSFASGVADEARRRMGSAVSQGEFKRWQAVWLAAGEDLSNEEIARITGLAVTTVRSVHARCRHYGVSSLADQPMGGRHHANLTLDQERALLADFFARAARGQVLIVAEIQAAVSKLVGRPVQSSGIYKMLARHNWRKVVPRPQHPHGDAEVRESFKKNFPNTSTPTPNALICWGAGCASSFRMRRVSGASAIHAGVGHPRPCAQWWRRST